MLRPSLRPAVLLALSLLLPSDGLAGGLNRRLPAVGEYARYTYSDVPIGAQSEAVHFALEGELVLRCVGRVEVEGHPHLWLEADLPCRVSTPEGEHASEMTLKVLVKEDGLLSHDCEIVRGWTGLHRGNLAAPVSGGMASELASKEVGQLMRMTILGIESETAIESTTEITLDEETLTLTTAVGGSSSSQRVFRSEEWLRNYESTWWLDESLAFGVPAWESTLSANDYSTGELMPERSWSTTLRLELVEFGTGATSRWPDHD